MVQTRLFSLVNKFVNVKQKQHYLFKEESLLTNMQCKNADFEFPS